MAELPHDITEAIANNHEHTMRQLEEEHINQRYDDNFKRLGNAALYVAAHALMSDKMGLSRNEGAFNVLPFRSGLHVAQAHLRIDGDRFSEGHSMPFIFKSFALRYVINDHLTGRTSDIELGEVISYSPPRIWDGHQQFGFSGAVETRNWGSYRHIAATALLHEAAAVADIRMDRWADVYDQVVDAQKVTA